MSITNVHAASGRLSIALWAVKIGLALAFIAASGAKFAGAPSIVSDFEMIGIGQWFRYITATFEAIGAILILIPALSVFGGLLLCGIMAGAVMTHLLILPGSVVPAVILLVLSGLVACAERRRLDMLFGMMKRQDRPPANGLR